MTEHTMFPYIVADVGGTNGRFGLVTHRDADTGHIEVENQHVFPCAEFDRFEHMLASYISSLEGVVPTAACIAIAGPVTGDHFHMTNLPWDFSIETVRKKLGLDRLEFMNDFAALAYSALYMEGDELPVLHVGKPIKNAPRAVVGPGTGLGVAGLVNASGRWYPIPGEGGHVTFAPASQKQLEIRKVIEPTDKHISAERFICGKGLANIYKALTVINGSEFEPLDPSEITMRALQRSDATCLETLSFFFEMLGSAAGNVCMTFGAWGGVYLGGGILPKVESELADSGLLASFIDKGRMGALLENVPVYLMKGDKPALSGAAHWLYDAQRADGVDDSE